ncbi:MAG TPA: DUF1598 domain-containing protein [Pirellulales bacterium]|jgi:hypothetical protein|nr:DUF1598 domain-containing protein [Pirellulales bacterium]
MRRRLAASSLLRNIQWLTLGLLVVLAAGVLSRMVAQADQPSDSSLLTQQLQTGEFAPALEAARVAGSASDRMRMLSAIAVAQASAGDHQAALQTTSQMDDDGSLSDTLSAIKAQPLTPAGRFGGNQADFDQLIDLITSTVAPASWSEMGGPGSIMGYPAGVYIDPHGVLRPLVKVDRSVGLAELRQASLHSASSDMQQSSALRKVSLVRLERQVELLAAQGRRPTEEIQAMAGLQRIRYVLVYPEQGDIVLAGPAGPWQTDREGRMVGKESGRPVLQLDDFVVILRRMMSAAQAPLGCNITPTDASLGEVKSFVSESNKTPLKPGQRDEWLKRLREKLGQQKIEVYGIDPRTRVGLVLVEADYRMKLVGMGLEEGVYGVPSYLDMIELAPGQSPPPMDVLRWWFTLNYDALAATPQHDAFELRGQGVQVLSENEMLTAAGQQIHTGNSDALNQQFARNFTKHFADLAVKYPIYAELQNMCDLALVCALVRSENLPDKVRWHMLYFGDVQHYQVPLAVAPKAVDTVINHRIFNKTTIIVGISGGVRIDPKAQVKDATFKTDNYVLPSLRLHDAPKKDDGPLRWWWD